MITGRSRIKYYLMPLLAFAFVCGCQTSKDSKEKQLATLRVHLQVVADSMDFSTSVPVYRNKPVMITIDRSEFLNETHVAEASVIDRGGGFDLQIQLNRQGTWLLEQRTAANPGKRIVIFSQFMTGGKREARWLAAPAIGRRIADGQLIFAPDATREEAEDIALGLNNVVKKTTGRYQW